jgi:hypothetical protein
MSKILELPIVGIFHHPPAMVLVKIIPLNANLWLRGEPENRYDSNAIAVDLDIDLLNLLNRPDRKNEFQHAFNSYRERHPDGPDFADVMACGRFHLGYLAAVYASQIVADPRWTGNVPGILRFDAKAKPLVKFELKGL